MNQFRQGDVLQIPTARVFVPLLKPARYKGADGGRGSGKTSFFAGNMIEECIAVPGTRAVCIREVQKTLAHSSKLALEDSISKYGLADSFDCKKSHIVTPGGGEIIFTGMQNFTAENIKSLEGFRIAWVEEAHTLSQRSLDLLRPTIRMDAVPDLHHGGELWFSWNGRNESDPVDAFFKGDEAPPDSVMVTANWRDNPWFPAVLEKERQWDQRRDPDKYQHIWEGGYLKRSAASVFTNWKVEEFETPSDAYFYGGADWGFSIDPSVLVRCFIQERTLYVDHEAYAVGCDIDFTPFLFAGMEDREVNNLNAVALKKLMATGTRYPGVPKCREFEISADSARPETISYMKKHGFQKIVPSIKGAGSLEDGVEFLKGFDIVVHPRCRHVIDELTFYRWKIDKDTEAITNVLEDKKNHTIDALRYAIEKLRRKRKRSGTW